MASPEVTRRAIAAAQAVLKEVEPSMIIDGKAGSFTLAAYNKAPRPIQSTVDTLMAALGAVGSIPAANLEYRATKSAAEAAPTQASSKRAIFDLQVVPAVTREARRRGLNPSNHVAQLALETGYGESTPLLAGGRPSYNYGGIKWQSVKTPTKVSAMTTEYVGGKPTHVAQDFAVFASADDFARAYFDYLFTGPSAYRYPGLAQALTPEKFGAILQKGGYATDPNYAKKFVDVASTVSRRYALANNSVLA